MADQWLAECGMAAVHRLAGWDGLLLLTAALLAAIYAWIAARLLHSGLHWLPTGLLLALILLVGSPQFHVRPLVLTHRAAGRHLRVAGRRGGRPQTAAAIVVARAAGGPLGKPSWRRAGRHRNRGPVRGRMVRHFGVGQAGCRANASPTLAWEMRLSPPSGSRSSWLPCSMTLAAATLINPYGLDLPREWLQTLTMPLPNLIEEHAPLSLTEPTGWATVLLALGYLAVLIGVLPERPRITWLVPLVWFVLALGRVRNAPLFGVTAAIALADMLPHSRVGKWLERREMLERRPVRLVRLGGRPSCRCWWSSRRWRFKSPGSACPWSGAVGRGSIRLAGPSDCCLSSNEINRSAAEGTPIFNDLNFGGFLIYHAPRLRVFVDDRCSLYGADFLAAYDRARRENPAQLDRWQQQYGFDYALVETGGRFDRHLAGAGPWTPLARTPAATLYRRK